MKVHRLTIDQKIPGGLLKFLEKTPVLAPFMGTVYTEQERAHAAFDQAQLERIEQKKRDAEEKAHGAAPKAENDPKSDAVPEAVLVNEESTAVHSNVEDKDNLKDKENEETEERKEPVGAVIAAVSSAKKIVAAGIDFGYIDGERSFCVDGSLDGISAIYTEWTPPKKWNLLVRKGMADHLTGLSFHGITQKHLMKRDPAASRVETRFMIDLPHQMAPTEFNADMITDFTKKWHRFIPALPTESDEIQALMRDCPIMVIVSRGKVVSAAVTRVHSDRSVLISGAYAEQEFAAREYRPACIESLCGLLERTAKPTIYSILDVKDYPGVAEYGKAGFSKKAKLMYYRRK